VLETKGKDRSIMLTTADPSRREKSDDKALILKTELNIQPDFNSG
jgi:hypothetical protein